MPLITIRDLSIRFRGPALLDGVDCTIEPGQRIGLLGRNGAGKTTLMRMLRGDVQPDHGQIIFAPGTKVSLLPQDVPQHVRGTVASVVGEGVVLDSTDADDEHAAEWRSQHQVDQILSRMELDPEAKFESLSSGMKRRVLLAQSLVSSPDMLLLDEPTNHLDIDAIGWLEEFLGRWNATLLFVTHDRMFLRKLATRIFEIDRGRLFDWSCDYDTFLQRKDDALAAEEKQNALFDKRLAQEEVWIRQGIKARRTRNEGRVRALKALRIERSERRSAVGKVNLQIQEGKRSGNLIAEVEGVSFSYDDKQIVRDFSTTIMRGDKVGLMGPNGAGKTTLLRILLGQLAPQAGSVRIGTNIEIAYFDQLREQLDEEKTVQEDVGEGSDTVGIGENKQHVIGYLQKFLFNPERARTPIRFLSGGERNRVLLAKLFCKPANVIVLDEPTNDLDTETLEMLEERLIEFQGTVLLVSHDRAFLNNVVTSTIVFEPGGAREYVGGYDDWIRQRVVAEDALAPRATKKKDSKQDSAANSSKRRLSYKEQRELDGLPAVIEKLEADVAKYHQQMAESSFYQQPREKITKTQAELKELEAKLTAAYARWEELEKMIELA
ncbi:MAG: ATP-binding cassette domain-containing protein [Planctomycetaceae bacterium]|nr:ATP-binding cassette domain-containing protein [Planctomycetales bacterium]MCB9875416.1 ATP-binding cassette domain-containing protein [Planctomycetaceae bacterium]MCB9939345.1 ATP-binding cassette domain-containing protein [Planctomycetaceae bacterium]